MGSSKKSPKSTQRYELITNHLRQSIEDGTLSPGDELPSEAELCEQYDSSRGPVRQAMALLRAEGLISTGRGRRSTVLTSAPSNSFESLLSMTAWAEDMEPDISQRTLWVGRTSADAHTACQLNVEVGSQIVTIKRLRLLNDEPLAIERLNFPLDVGRPLLDFDTDNCSVHRELSRLGVGFESANRSMSAALSNGEDSELLGIPEGSPIMQVELLAASKQGRTLEYAEYRVIGEGLVLHVNNVRGTPTPAWFSRES
ncbi:HTH-type transcriptional repressor YvoA [Corynebacterium atrinae]|uniref:GntR family transcriptional regulator n=1 Tax=Corynebacterium atrinae TaxID=1336740 RepID=UPI0025B573D9|nr:GntR family transcriptional regulator [Corynebacterium atrinae]WJY63958.1 HTH-type transcriptional repressor YvoA [Corynebacterium atrinae]